MASNYLMDTIESSKVKKLELTFDNYKQSIKCVRSHSLNAWWNK